MPSRNPDFRFRAVQEAVKRKITPIDARERALYLLLTNGGNDETIAYAHELYQSEYQREVLQAWIAAGATSADIETNLRVPSAVSDAYRWLFFDLTAFRDRLALLEWVNTYRGTPFGKTVLQQAVMTGLKGLQWQFNLGDVKVDPKAVIQQAMTDSFYRSRAGRLAGITSAEAEAAHKHMKTAVSAATTLAKSDTGNLLSELLIKLQHRDLTTSIHEEQPENIMH